MSQMSTEEDIELHITPSADDILEVSPVNSFAQLSYHSSVSPTASLRHRRNQQANEHAFSSSSEGSTGDDDDEEEEEENDDDDYEYDDTQQPLHSITSSIYTAPDESESQHEPADSSDPQHRTTSSNNISRASSASPTSSTERLGSKGEGNQPQHQQQQPPPPQQQPHPIQTNHTHQSQSEFDKALLTGVPSRGFAVSFFSADSVDSADGSASIADALDHHQQHHNHLAGLEEDDISATPTNTTSHSYSQASAPGIKSKKGHKTHRVNITATTQSSAASVVSVTSAASSTYNNNNNNTTASINSLVNKNNSTTNNTPAIHNNASYEVQASVGVSSVAARPSSGAIQQQQQQQQTRQNLDDYDDNIHDLSSGVLPDVLMTMRQKIESMQLFDSDLMKLAATDSRHMDEMATETRESLKRSSQQSISAAVLVSLAHKRYERRRLAAMEIEKVVRSLVQQNELDRVRAILLLLSDDYVRSTSEDARKGGVVALAACAIGLKKAHDDAATVMECRDLILASVVHACQDHSQRVRYYATESLFNVVKVIPGLAVQHFFILFEILRSLYADVDLDVRSGAELLDKKLKEVIVGAMNSGSFSTDACVPVFARFVYMRNKATKRLTLTWLQELNEKLIGAPILEFLHLFLGGIFDMIADPSLAIRQSALAFLQSVLPKLLVVNSEAIDDMDDAGMKVDFDKILQSLVMTLEHPDPFVRKVATYWMSRIVRAHMKELNARSLASKKSKSMLNPDGRLSPNRNSGSVTTDIEGESNIGDDLEVNDGGSGDTGDDGDLNGGAVKSPQFSAASISVRNSLPHVLPGILLRYVHHPTSLGTYFVANEISISLQLVLVTASTLKVAQTKIPSFRIRQRMNSPNRRMHTCAMR
jgi:Vacuolar 14 Fab1-binding region